MISPLRNQPDAILKEEHQKRGNLIAGVIYTEKNQH
jgi:hypothetical protein